MMIAIFITLASICNAIMDSVDHHYNDTVFSLIKSPKWRLWFNENMGWKNKYINRDVTQGRVKWKIWRWSFNKPVQFTDAWHHFKMWMIIFLCCAAISGIVFGTATNFLPLWAYPIGVLILGTLWNTVFSFFYDHALKLKK